MRRGLHAYRQTMQQTGSTKALEARALGQLCYALEQTTGNDDVIGQIQARGQLEQAWFIIQHALQDPSHPYPAALRQQLLGLAAQVLEALQQQPANDALVLAVTRELQQHLDAD